jgi:hypothetical protein
MSSSSFPTFSSFRNVSSSSRSSLPYSSPAKSSSSYAAEPSVESSSSYAAELSASGSYEHASAGPWYAPEPSNPGLPTGTVFTHSKYNDGGVQTAVTYVTTSPCAKTVTTHDSDGTVVTKTITEMSTITGSIEICGTCTGVNYPHHTGAGPWLSEDISIAFQYHGGDAVPTYGGEDDGWVSGGTPQARPVTTDGSHGPGASGDPYDADATAAKTGGEAWPATASDAATQTPVTTVDPKDVYSSTGFQPAQYTGAASAVDMVVKGRNFCLLPVAAFLIFDW